MSAPVFGADESETDSLSFPDSKEPAFLELVQTLHAAAHGLEVGEHAAQPAGVDIVHADALGLFFWCLPAQ